MTYKPSNSQNTFVDSSVFLPEDAHQQTLKLTDTLRSYSSGINSREIGQYYLNEINAGSTLFSSNPQKNRPIYRKVVNFGALPNTSAKSVPHGIAIDSGYRFLKLYAVGTNPAATGATPYTISLADTNSTLTATLTDVVITTSADYSPYTECYVVLEYAKTA